MQSELKPKRFLAWSVLNRDLCQLEFFRRVIEEATEKSTPVLEKLKFLSVFSSNLDEFFMVRVSGIKEMSSIDDIGPMPGELTPEEQLPVIRKKVLTPQAVDPARPFPYISNLSLNIGLTVESNPEDTLAGSPLGNEVRFVRIKVPPVVPRLIPVSQGELKFALVEEVIEANIHSLFPSMNLSKGHLFRVTRDADVEIRDDKAADLLALIKESLRERRFGLAVRLEVSSSMPAEMVDYLTKSLNIDADDVYRIGALLDVPDLMELYNLDLPELKDKPLRAIVPVALRNKESLFEAIRKQDVLLHHPYS